MTVLPDAWRYPFFEEPELRRSRVALRPVVPITVAGLPLDRALDVLLDTGSETSLRRELGRPTLLAWT